jgi:hypothetical protein
MMRRRHSINKIIPLKQEQLAGYDIVALTIAEAYSALRQACPTGDLHVRLSVEETEDNEEALHRERVRLSRHERHQLAADNGVDTWEEYRGER